MAIQLEIESGKYVLAVSGGVDSMVLLDLIRRQEGLDLIAAHFNHGIRSASELDEELVKKSAERYKIPFEVGYGKLGAEASEAAAREARYKFLEKIRRKYDAQAVVTAHHQDDLIETAFLNLLRGTGAQGLVAMRSNKEIQRPLIKVPKAEILAYAKQHRLKWLDDETNDEMRFLRNYLRQKILPALSEQDRNRLLANLDKVAYIQEDKNHLIATLSQSIVQNDKIDRSKFNILPACVSDEMMHYWLDKADSTHIGRREISRLSSQLKTAKAGQRLSVTKKLSLEVSQKTILLRTTD
jgi:tRNA(Ile)-lysidine synthase